MYGKVLGASTVSSTAGVAVLPNTGSFRFMFIVAVVTLAIGLATLAVTGAAYLRHRFSKVA
jgi:hypothetical protein